MKTQQHKRDTQLSSTNMKSLIVFCFLAALCVLQVSAYNELDQLNSQAKQSKNNVNRIMRSAQLNRNNLSNSIKMNLSNLKINSMMNINDYVNPTLDKIRAEVNAAKEKGIDAEQCYIDAKYKLGVISQTGFSVLQQCKTNAESLLEVQLRVLEKIEATGNDYLYELSFLFGSCYSSDSLEMQNCIALKLGNINNSIKSYENAINSQFRYTEKTARRAVIEANSCNINAVSKVYADTTNTTINASRCIGG
ncbi:uncharacterized protein LOC122396881 [Colletes gigas]|uniref:uncharacterized protein LOC122396881 n=1 Tax=Colletes gigas TaxID=935657 RepID=UPI001C9A7939|nr:uncharacterized protein LOC122396881 [Colletes gigas]